MNILFLCRTYNVGGVNVVTQFLSEKFSQDGHNVCILSLDGTPKGMEKRYSAGVCCYDGVGDRFSIRNILIMYQLLKKEETNYVINNWGMQPEYILMIRMAHCLLKKKVKIISIYHNNPVTNGWLQRIELLHEQAENKIQKKSLFFIKKIIKILSVLKFKIVYDLSDNFVLLSDCFVESFFNFTHIRKRDKIKIIPNPITIKNEGFKFDYNKKQKEIIFVGRLDEVQKRISRIIDIWNIIESKYKDWNLTIVGDGPSYCLIQEKVRGYSLKNVSFVGYQHPQPYYERASILMLTSEFEGFGLVIVEGMQYGVVPIVYGSYPAVYDIIENNKDGIIIPYHEEGFDIHEASQILESIMIENEKRKRLAIEALERSNRFSIDNVSNLWYSLFKDHCMES